MTPPDHTSSPASSAADPARRLPRLLVVSDVSVERTGGGALVLYRLLRHYPAGKLMVVTRKSAYWSGPVDRVAGVEYRELSYRIPRLVFNRFSPFWPVVMSRYIRRRTPEVQAAADAFRPEAILSVAHDYLWFVADVLAARLRIPHHLIIHDDWPALQTLSQPEWIRPSVRSACDLVYAGVLRRARTRFCVSPGMRQRYADRYGVDGQVLYPSRGADSPSPKMRVRSINVEPPVVAYAGMIHQGWTAVSLRALGEALAGMGGRLDLYVPYPADRLAEWGLAGPNVRVVGFFPAAEMADRVAATAGALFLPASFNDRERVDVSTLFPSKLADYTAIGLPILIWGPEYSSAAQWSAANPGAAELVTDPDPAALTGPLGHLADPDYARRVAEASVDAGMRDFDEGVIRDRFISELAAG